MRRSAVVLAIASLGGVLTIGAVSNVAAARVRPASTTCSVLDGYSPDSPPLSGQAVCAYGSGTVFNGGGTIQWANGHTSTFSPPASTTQVSDRRCPAVAGATLSIALNYAGVTVVSGPLAGSHFRGKLCLYMVNASHGVPPGLEYFQNEGSVHL